MHTCTCVAACCVRLYCADGCHPSPRHPNAETRSIAKPVATTNKPRHTPLPANNHLAPIHATSTGLRCCTVCNDCTATNPLPSCYARQPTDAIVTVVTGVTALRLPLCDCQIVWDQQCDCQVVWDQCNCPEQLPLKTANLPSRLHPQQAGRLLVSKCLAATLHSTPEAH